tara:strand:- start:242 stop:499 length:258 start_codon:yes stop_codon:yes gene_type:complete
MKNYIYYKSNKELNRSATIHSFCYDSGETSYHIIAKEGQPKTYIWEKRAEDIVVSTHRKSLDKAIDCVKQCLGDDCLVDGIYEQA